MKKQKIILLISGLFLFVLIYFGGNTVPPKKKMAPMPSAMLSEKKTITTDEVIVKAKQHLTAEQTTQITELENSVVRGDVKSQQAKVYAQLSNFWTKDMGRPDLGAYYTGQEGLLENSEKKLTFAAHLLLNGVLVSDSDPAMQNWLATNAKTFFDKALEINPSNDSTKVGIGACYMFGNISDNPMQGILPVRAITEKDPKNIFAQMILGMGGIKSGQYENAVKRFQAVLDVDPSNLEATLNLAETYDRMGDKTNAVKWYKVVQDKIEVPDAKKEIEERIKALQQ